MDLCTFDAGGHMTETEADLRRKRPQKRQFLVQIDAGLIRRTKIMAIQRRVSASSLVEEALEDFLSRQPVILSDDPESR
jgi:predicted HicB family RNase H-like nuclease